MSDVSKTDSIFFTDGELDKARAESIVNDTLKGADDGELFLEYKQSENIVFEDGRIRSASYDTSQGFGLRAVSGEVSGFAHSSDMSEAGLLRAADAVKAVKSGHSGILADAPRATNQALYTDDNPLGNMTFENKVDLLHQMDAYARDKDPRVKQVSASIGGSWQAVHILRPGGLHLADIRPMVRVNVSVVVEQGDRMESGSHGSGGRSNYELFVTPDHWQGAVDEALRQAVVNLDSVAAPAGETTVVLGPGWPGILLHEAVGHGLEGDFNRKKTSVFSGLLGERVAAPGVTVVDDGTIPDRRGSITIDDEGTPAGRNVLIEDGILKGFMQDRMNARLMGVDPTGNGRRQSHAHMPIPRMTNTYMLGGDRDPQEILESVKDGIFTVNFGGGQVDITNGKFVFSCTEAYKIENGKLGAPVKGATLIGSGADALTRISMIGNDMSLDPGVGTCGKDGQGVPVGVGQPTLRLDDLTVGGTAA
ncbi:metalloprotease TldD [Curvivirga aplysinae]|uniref:metalloprotease TldD n=1 Tax=Curvivirga aplysinae TaxID=2529852 RepID=UPI0012BC2319|nr:metalloprotease TldD [Curvivirga aplysinae]MTI11330.1 metalloprotease TldD [Curvivirga aplysinae]